MIRERVPGADKVVLSTHNHNDLGLAVANTLAAIQAGVRQVECTINGIGERAGNASLEEIVMAIKTRNDAVPYRNSIKTTNILRLSKLLSTITGFDVQPNKAIVGTQRLRTRGRHPSGRRAEERRHLRDHDAGERWLDQEQPGDGQAFRAAPRSATS